jgi:hypothetical protein
MRPASGKDAENSNRAAKRPRRRELGRNISGYLTVTERERRRRARLATEDAAPRSSVPGPLWRAGKLAAVIGVAVAMGLPVANAEIVQHGDFRVKFDAALTPKRLPRDRQAPVRFSTSVRFIGVGGHAPPQLRKMQIEINAHGHLNPGGVPTCQMEEIQPASSINALAACRRSLVGEGHLSSEVKFTQQAPFPSEGKIQAFNGRWKGKPAILAHVYGRKPIPTSFTIPFVISSRRKGTYGTILAASVPQFSGKWGYVSAISLMLGDSAGRYLTAGCPTPKGIAIASFALSRTKLSFSGTTDVTQVLSRTCRPY